MEKGMPHLAHRWGMGCLDVWCYRRAGSWPGRLAFELGYFGGEASVVAFGVVQVRGEVVELVFPFAGFSLAGEAHSVLGVLGAALLVVFPCGDQRLGVAFPVGVDFGAGVVPAGFAVVLCVDGGDDGRGEFGCVHHPDDGVTFGWFGAGLFIQGAANTAALSELHCPSLLVS